MLRLGYVFELSDVLSFMAWGLHRNYRCFSVRSTGALGSFGSVLTVGIFLPPEAWTDKEDAMSSAKQVAVIDFASPLEDAGILLHTYWAFVGPGQHLFISAVSKTWRESYKRLASVQVDELTWNYYEDAVVHTITPQTTLCSAVFTSAALVSLAHECGLTFNKEKLKRIAGKIADVPALRIAQESGLQLTFEVLVGAAEAEVASIPKL
jgi:hypothetical protein